MKNQEYKYSFKNEFRSMASMSVYRIGYEKRNPGFSEGMVTRDFYYLHFVESGKGIFQSNGGKFAVNTGDAFLVYPHVPITHWADLSDPWKIWWVGFDGNDAHLMMNATRFIPEMPVITPKKPDRMLRLIKDIYKYRGERAHEFILMTSKLYALLSYLIEDATPDLDFQSNRPDVTHIQHARDYISNHYMEQISVEDIAASVNLSRSQLFRLFKRNVSLSPSQYLTEFRIREACNMMVKTFLSIKEIAYSVGFEETQYFSTVFKRITGKTPGEYIKQQAKPTPQP
jgi:AraC-like DNA-binding protein